MRPASRLVWLVQSKLTCSYSSMAMVAQLDRRRAHVPRGSHSSCAHVHVHVHAHVHVHVHVHVRVDVHVPVHAHVDVHVPVPVHVHVHVPVHVHSHVSCCVRVSNGARALCRCGSTTAQARVVALAVSFLGLGL